MQSWDVIIIGAGAAGLMCAIEAGKRGRRVLLLDHAAKPAEKIRISGGGRCNFTNLHAAPDRFLSANPKFCISALKGYTQRDFIALVEKHGIAYHEKTLGQLFCDDSSRQIIDMLLAEAAAASVDLCLGVTVEQVERLGEGFQLTSSLGELSCSSLVVACGGKSIPKMGATGFGYDLARQFDLAIEPTRAALVPFTFEGELKEKLAALSGLSVNAVVGIGRTRFEEALLFTHRGLSGPAILQISSYWSDGQAVDVDLCPGTDVLAALKEGREKMPRQSIERVLSGLLPRRLVESILAELGIEGRIGEAGNKVLERLAGRVNRWRVLPSGTEGYRTAEVTAGGVSTAALSSKTMEVRGQPGLFFIGEVVDVTGHLGGYNFQWAWSSGYAAGQAV